MMDIKTASLDDLHAEIGRREEEEVARRFAARDKRLALITAQAVDAFVPEHGRTSCSDDNRANGFGSGGRAPRCNRCALLDIVEHGPSSAGNMDVSISIYFPSIEGV